MDAILKALEQQEAALTVQLQDHLTDYGKLQTLSQLYQIQKQLNTIYKQQLANIKRHGSINK